MLPILLIFFQCPFFHGLDVFENEMFLEVGESLNLCQPGSCNELVITCAFANIKNLIRQEKEIKGTQVGREEVNRCSLFADDMILYVENPSLHSKTIKTDT